MFGSDDNRGVDAPTTRGDARAAPVLENAALAAAALACAIVFSLVLSQPLAPVANEDEFQLVTLASVHW